MKISRTVNIERCAAYRLRKLAHNPHWDADRRRTYRKRHPRKYRAELCRNRAYSRRWHQARYARLKGIVLWGLIWQIRLARLRAVEGHQGHGR
jgi:hypothetical protein